MTDPFTVFPRTKDGRLRDGYYRFVKHHEFDGAMKAGWRPVELADSHGCHHDEYSVLCGFVGGRWRRLIMAIGAFFRMLR